MAETEVSEISQRIPQTDLRKVESKISPQEANRLFSLAPALEALGKLKYNFATLINNARDLGGLIDEKYHAARIATAGTILALTAACGQAESDFKISPTEPEYQPTATRQSMEALPSTQTPIIQETQTPTPTTESTPITKGETPTPTPESKTIQPEQNISNFNLIKEKLKTLELQDDKKIEISQSLDKLEKIDGVVDQFITAYQQEQGPDGKPLLFSLVRQKFGYLDFSPIIKLNHPYKSEDALIEDQIFFLRDHKQLTAFTINLLNANNAQEFLKVFQKMPTDLEFYLTVGTISQRETPFIEPIPENLKSIVEQVQNQLPSIGKVKIVIESLPLGIKANHSYTPDFAIIRFNEKMTIFFSQEDLLVTLAHETGHSLEISPRNRQLLKYLTPQKAVSLMIASESALNDPVWGVRYKSLESLLNPQRLLNPVRLNIISPEDFGSITSSVPDKTWVKQEAKIFDQYLESALLDQYINEGKEISNKILAERNHDLIPYSSWQEFYEKEMTENGKLRILAQSSPIWDFIISKATPGNLETFYKLGSSGMPLPVTEPAVFWITLENFGKTVLAGAFMENDPKIAEFFNKDQRRIIIYGLINEIGPYQTEKWAESIAATIVYKNKIASPEQNPYLRFLEETRTY